MWKQPISWAKSAVPDFNISSCEAGDTIRQSSLESCFLVSCIDTPTFSQVSVTCVLSLFQQWRLAAVGDGCSLWLCCVVCALNLTVNIYRDVRNTAVDYISSPISLWALVNSNSNRLIDTRAFFCAYLWMHMRLTERTVQCPDDRTHCQPFLQMAV